MRLRLLPLVLCLTGLSGCLTTLPSAPAKIDPPPILLTTACLTPDDLKEGATAQDLALWALSWIDAYWCERERREGLIEAWPK